MAKRKVHICDDILYNILGRLPGKALLRFRCVSKHWNNLISDPYLMKSRSRRMILLPFPRPLVVIDDNVPVKDKAHYMVGIHSPIEEYHGPGIDIHDVSIVGTCNGIVLLALTDCSSRCHLVLYNPLTCASKKLLVMDPPPRYDRMIQYVFGFGYGATTSDLKVVRFKVFNQLDHFVYQYECDVYALKTRSWSRPPGEYFGRPFKFSPDSPDAGLFLNGFLYWSTEDEMLNFRVLALNVEKMVFSIIELPDRRPDFLKPLILGSIDGCLCTVSRNGLATRFGLWVMKQQGEWSQTCSFSIRFGSLGFNDYHPVCILGNGKILLTTRSMILFMYDPSKDSCTMLYNLLANDDSKKSASVYFFMDTRSIEYVESLVLPSEICNVSSD